MSVTKKTDSSDLLSTETESRPRQDGRQVISMRLSKDTIKRADELKIYFGSTSRTDAVVQGVRLAHAIIREVKDDEGAWVELHRGDGEICKLIL